MAAPKKQPSAAERRARERAAKLERALSTANKELARVRKTITKLESREQESRLKHAAELEAARLRNPPATAPPTAIADMPPPPEDPLAAQAYAHHMLMMMLHNAATDTKISDRERRKEMRTIAASAAKLMPRARLHAAEQRVLRQVAELERKARDRRGAKLEPLPKPRATDAPLPQAQESRVEEPQP